MNVNAHMLGSCRDTACVFVDVEDEVETPGRPRLLLREAFRDSRWIGPNTALQRGEVV